MKSLIKVGLLVSFAVAFVFLGPSASPAVAEALNTDDVPFANPDELSDCTLAPPAFSGFVHIEVYETADPDNPALPHLTPGNPDTFTVIFTITNDILLNLPAECEGGPYNGDPNTADLYKMAVGTFNLGYGDFPFPVPADVGTIDDGNPATPAPSDIAFTGAAVEFVFDAPNIAPGQTTQMVFFTIPSIEPDEVANYTVQSTGGSTDDEQFVPLPRPTVATEEMNWGAFKAKYR